MASDKVFPFQQHTANNRALDRFDISRVSTTTKRGELVFRCGYPRCPQSVGIAWQDLATVFQSERSCRRAFRQLGWKLLHVLLRPPLGKPRKCYVLYCPNCSPKVRAEDTTDLAISKHENERT